MKVCMNRVCDVPGIWLYRCRGVDDDPKRFNAAIFTGAAKDISFGFAAEYFPMKWRRVQRVKQLVNALNPDIDGFHYRVAQTPSRTSTTMALAGTR